MKNSELYKTLKLLFSYLALMGLSVKVVSFFLNVINKSDVSKEINDVYDKISGGQI